MAKNADVIAFAIGHTPGSLHNVLRELEKLNISIEYMYAFSSRLKKYDAIVIMRLNDQDEALAKLNSANIGVLGQDLIDSLNET